MEISSGSPLWQARWREEAPRPALVRFVLLSMLLHATIVILFGTSHGGGDGRGETVLDALDVTLSRPPAFPASDFRPREGATTDAGRDLLRHDELLRTAPKPPRSEPTRAAEPTESISPPSIEAPVVVPDRNHERFEAAPPLEERRIEPLPRIDLRAPQEVDRPVAPPPIASPPIEHLGPPPNPPALAAPPELAPRREPFVPAAPLDTLPPPGVRRELAPPVELRPSPPLPVPAAPIEHLASPPTAQELAPALELKPRPVPIPEAPIERLALPPAASELAPPLELPPPVAPVVPAPLDRLSIPRLDHDLAPSPTLIAPAPAAPPAPSPSVAPQVQRATSPAASAPATPVPSTPAKPTASVPTTPPDARAAPATPEAPRLRLGAPSPEEDMFKPRSDVVAPDQAGGERIDMDAARKRAREIAGEATSTRGILPALPPPAEKKSKESLALEKAMKPDCRTAYAGLGLLAVPALVVSTIGDGGCRW